MRIALAVAVPSGWRIVRQMRCRRPLSKRVKRHTSPSWAKLSETQKFANTIYECPQGSSMKCTITRPIPDGYRKRHYA
jgi:hypothetical protein